MGKLLLVEDDADVAGALAEVLREAGHAVRVAPDGMQGLRWAAEDPPELILLDVEMPALDGPSMLRRMAVDDRGLEQIPVALVSGAHRVDRIASELGTPYFLVKPFRLQEALALIRRALAERRAPRSLVVPEERP